MAESGPSAFDREPIRVAIESPRVASVNLTRAQLRAQPDLLLWWLIEKSTDDLSFKKYQAFVDWVLCGKDLPYELLETAESMKSWEEKGGKYAELAAKRRLPFTD